MATLSFRPMSEPLSEGVASKGVSNETEFPKALLLERLKSQESDSDVVPSHYQAVLRSYWKQGAQFRSR